MGDVASEKFATAAWPATTATDWADERKPMRRALKRCAPAGPPASRYRPSLSVTAPRVVPSRMTVAPGTGAAPSALVTRPVTVPPLWASAVDAAARLKHIARMILRPMTIDPRRGGGGL